MPKRATAHLTDRSIRALPVPPAGAVITYDSDAPGFGIRVTAKGVRSFVLNYMVSGRERRFIKGQKYTLLSRRENLTTEGKRALRLLFRANRRLNSTDWRLAFSGPT